MPRIRDWLLALVLLGASTPAFAQPFVTRDLTSATCPGTGCVVLQVDGQGSLGVQVTGTFVGTLQFEQSIDGVTYVSLAMVPNTLGATVTSTTAIGFWTAPIAGARWVRVRFSAYTSGTATVNNVTANARASPASAVNGAGQLLVNEIAVTSTDGLSLINNTPATGGVTVQMSPRLRWRGTAWDTAASETVDFFAEVLPATAATPTGTWKLGYSLNGAAATYPLTVTSAGNVFAAGFINSGGGTGSSQLNGNLMGFSGRITMTSLSDGNLALENSGLTIGSNLKVDALPTVSSGFGTSPAVTAGSTPLAGSVNVGTGGVATSGIINFNGTAFPSAPFVVCMNTTTAAVLRCTSTTTQLTITAPAAFTASDVVTWIAISSK